MHGKKGDTRGARPAALPARERGPHDRPLPFGAGVHGERARERVERDDAPVDPTWDPPLELVVDAMPALISYVDRDLVYRYCNSRYTEWFGIERSEIVGRRAEDIVGEEAFERVRPYFERVFRGEPVTYEGRIPYRHGRTRDVCVRLVPDTRPDGDIVGCYAMVEDVSGRIAQESARARLAAIVEQSGDAIIGKDVEGMVTSWNRGAERMYGFTADEMLGRSLTRITPPGREPEVGEIIARLLRGEAVENMETIRRTKDGRDIVVAITASLIRDAGGEVTGISTVERDLTDLLAQQREMLATDARLRVAKNAAELGIFEYDIQSNEIEWDEILRSIWGIGPDEPIEFGTFVAGLHPDDRAPTIAAVDRSLDPDGDRHYCAEYRVVHRETGVTRWIYATGSVTFEGRVPIRMVGAVQDVTPRRLAEEALRDADRRKDEFLATLGHELRNPLATLVHTVECLRRGVPPETREDFYEVMARQAGHMTSLLNDLLDVARITRGDVRLRPELIAVDTLLERAVETMRSELDSGGHEIVASVEPEDLQVQGDPVRLEQVLVNLLSNAVTYTPEPGVISVSARRDGGVARIVVRDPGVGFSESERQRMFELFYQARKGSGGLGIGLNLVQSLVALHGGAIEARSEGPGRGTEMIVTLPLATERAQSAAAADTPSAVELGELKVLVVDDVRDHLLPIQLLLSDHCAVRTAVSGDEAVAVAEDFVPDVLLLDLALGDESGIDVAQRLRAIPGLEGAVPIALTGFGDETTARQVRDAGFHAHVVKPVDIDRLLELLGEVAAAGRS